MSDKLLPTTTVPVNSLVPFSELNTVDLSNAVAEYEGDRVALDKALRGAETNSRAARLLNAWQWGCHNPALPASERGAQGGRGNTKLVSESEKGTLALGNKAAARYRKIARVPLSRLEAWITAQLAINETITFGAFEQTRWYILEQHRVRLEDDIEKHPNLDLDAKHDDWTEAHQRRIYLQTVVREMERGASEGEASGAAIKASLEASAKACQHDFESYRKAYIDNREPSRLDMVGWLDLASTDSQRVEAEAALAKFDADNRMPLFMADLERHITGIEQLFKRVPVPEVTRWAIDNDQFGLLSPYRERLHKCIAAINEPPIDRDAE